jgi:acetylornithine deacetylase/succinyl-diaminopimelate desuccinylase-like protein
MKEEQVYLLLRTLLATASFNPSVSKMPDVLSTFFTKSKIPFKVFTYNGISNLVAHTGGERIVILNAHWDTVLPSEAYNRSVLPVKEEEGYVYGLGACDMKGGLVAMLATFLHCFENGIEGVTISLTGDEEVGGVNGTKQLVDQGIVAPYVILGEPTGLAISLGQKGALRIHMKAHGSQAHGAYPHKGDNAILKMNTFIRHLLRRFPLLADNSSAETVFRKVTASVNTISGGFSPNVVPNECLATCDVRIPPGVNLDEVRRTIVSLAHAYTIDVLFEEGAMSGWRLDKKSRLFSVSKRAIKSITKESPQFIIKMGSNDGRYYVPHGSEIINIGPGDSALSHTAHERISLQQIADAQKIYTAIIEELCTKYGRKRA